MRWTRTFEFACPAVPGTDKARLRHELGTRFSKFAVRLAKDFQQKAREEGGDNAHATALRYALDEPWIRSRCCGG